MQIHLDERRLQELMAKPEALQLFPFLQLTKTVNTGRCKCNRNKVVPDYETMKQQIAKLDNEQMTKLKELFKADSIVIYYQNGDSVVNKEV